VATMPTNGDILRAERLRRGLKLAELASQTKIGQRYLEAIEANQLDRLPGGIFARSFVRQYAEVLGLKTTDIAIPPEPEPEATPAALIIPPHSLRLQGFPHVPALAVLALAMLAASAIYKFWEAKQHTPAIAAVHSSISSHQAVVSSSSSTRTTTAASAQPPPPVSASDLATRTTPAQEDSARVSSAVRVTFAASEPVWLSVKSDGTSTYSGTLDELESKEFGAANQMTVLVGNVGGLRISLNGIPVPLKGAHGEVRSLVLTSAGARALPRPSPAKMSDPANN
jgi:cytoskeleton protein RodZ